MNIILVGAGFCELSAGRQAAAKIVVPLGGGRADPAAWTSVAWHGTNRRGRT